MYDKDLKEILDDAYSRIDLAEDAIDLRVKKDDDIAALINLNTSGALIYGKNVSLLGQNGFKFTAGGSLEEDPVTGDLKEVLDNAYSQIYASKDEINLKVSKDGIITAINIAPGVVTIDAEKLNISGIVTAGGLALEGDLSALNASFSNLVAGTTTAAFIKATTLQATSGLTVGASGIYSSGTISSEDIYGTALRGSSLNIANGASVKSLSINGSDIDNLFLGKTAKAADSNKLDGKLSSDFVLNSSLVSTLSLYTKTTDLNTLLDGKSNTGHSHTKSNISDFPTRTSAEFVTAVTRSVTTGNAITAYSAQGVTYGEFVKTVTLTVTKNTYYFYT